MFPYSLQARIEVTGFRPPEYISAICCGPEKRKARTVVMMKLDDFTSVASPAQNFLVLETAVSDTDFAGLECKKSSNHKSSYKVIK